jgi:hypothetical protein
MEQGQTPRQQGQNEASAVMAEAAEQVSHIKLRQHNLTKSGGASDKPASRRLLSLFASFMNGRNKDDPRLQQYRKGKINELIAQNAG